MGVANTYEAYDTIEKRLGPGLEAFVRTGHYADLTAILATARATVDASPPGAGAHGGCGYNAAGSALRHLRITPPGVVLAALGRDQPARREIEAARAAFRARGANGALAQAEALLAALGPTGAGTPTGATDRWPGSAHASWRCSGWWPRDSPTTTSPGVWLSASTPCTRT
jgi:hypothetical protein